MLARLAALSLLTASTAFAQNEELALTFPDASVTSYYPTATGTDSYNITPLVDIAVTSLCYYDRGADGMTQDHPVALYDGTTGAEMAYTIVTNDSPLFGNFRCEPIEPVVFLAGQPYQMGGYTYVDSARDWAYAVQNLGVSSSITYDGYVNEYNQDGDVKYVVRSPIDIFFFGPNFIITTDIPVADADDDGVPDDVDACLGTASDESDFPYDRFGTQRNLVIDGALMQNFPRGLRPSAYSLEETDGCSCEQILTSCDEAGATYGEGHYRFGCSNSVVEAWATGLTGTYGVPHPDGGYRCK